MFSPHPALVYPHAWARSKAVRATGGGGSSCCMYRYSAMWLAFHCADAVSAGETLSAGRPSEARWAFTSSTTRPARSPRGAGQSAAMMQSPTATLDAVSGVAAGTTAASASRMRTRDILKGGGGV